MVKYILVGGYRRSGEDKGKGFAQELVRGHPEPIKILDILFARPTERWGQSFQDDLDFFVQNLPSSKIELEMAQVGSLTTQVQAADIIYLKGGDSTTRLIRGLTQDKGWVQHLDGKTVAGTSAGAYAICEYYHQLDPSSVGRGLGLLPYKILTHWQSAEYGTSDDWAKFDQELQDFGGSEPVLRLREGEFRVLELSDAKQQ
jgi:peptidase E